MARGKTQNLGKELILSTLAKADELSKRHGDALAEQVPNWVERIAYLCQDRVPRSYLPIFCVLLTARAMRERDALDVLTLTVNAGSKGYSSQSIGKYLIQFAINCQIDLRTRSTNVMNSQPFTHKRYITAGMSGDQHATAFAKFLEYSEFVQNMKSQEALTVLAYVFQGRRFDDNENDMNVVVNGGRDAFDSLTAAVSVFVEATSDSGKVGQAFAAALYDVLYGHDQVRMGGANDPSFSIAGDVQVGTAPRFWLWSEVKQSAITTSEVQVFLERVRDIGGERVSYFALSNHRYPDQLNERKLMKLADKLGIDMSLYLSPADAMSDLLSKAPGPFSHVASGLATRFTVRLHESQASKGLEGDWREVLAQFE
jgi:hypothetical protein